MHELDEYKYPANYVFPDDNANDVVAKPEDKDMKIVELLAEIKKLKALLQAKDNDLDFDYSIYTNPVIGPPIILNPVGVQPTKPVVKAATTKTKGKVKPDKSVADIILSFV